MHHNKDYNILLKKLISGTITDKERWTLERASLDDSFLADAIEGIYDNDVDLSTKLTLKNTTKTRRLSWFKPLAVAASVILLLGFSFLIVQNMDKNTSGVVVEAESNEPMDSGTLTGLQVNNDIVLKEEVSSTQKEIKQNSEIIAEAQQKTPVKSKTQTTTVELKEDKDWNKPTPTEHKKSELKDREDDRISISEESEMLADEEASPPQFESRAKRKMNAVDGVPILSQQIVQGHVYDQGGIPISKALISTEMENDSALTNAEGYFAMTVTDMNQQINIQSAGFSDQSTFVKPELSITLQKAQSALGQEPMLLVETMDSNELETEYSSLLDDEFREPFSICPQEQNSINRIKLRIEISDSGQLLNLDYITNLSENCQIIIEDKIRKMSLQGDFKGKEAVTFYYNLRL